MNGNITSIHITGRGNQSYGFILGENGDDYFFHKTNLINCSMSQLQEGDPVEFIPKPSHQKPGTMIAVNIRKRTTSAPTAIQYAYPGIHRDVEVKRFNQDEQAIIQSLSNATLS